MYYDSELFNWSGKVELEVEREKIHVVPLCVACWILNFVVLFHWCNFYIRLLWFIITDLYLSFVFWILSYVDALFSSLCHVKHLLQNCFFFTVVLSILAFPWYRFETELSSLGNRYFEGYCLEMKKDPM